MRIIQITGFMADAQKAITEAIHSHLLEMGEESYILYAKGHSELPGTIRYESTFSRLFTRFMRKAFGKHPAFSLFQTLRLLHFLQNNPPDVIHLHVLHHGCVQENLLLRYLKRKRIPVVFTLHDLWVVTGGCYHYAALPCTGYESGCRNCPKAKAQLDVERCSTGKSYERKKQLLLSLPSLHLVSVSPWVKGEMAKSFLKDRPLSVIPNGVSLPETLQSLPPIPKKNALILGVAAHWTKEKGIDLLLELAGLLGEKYTLCLVGHATADVQKAAPANVHFAGYCKDKEQLFAYYQAAALHISASKEETLGMTFVEAACAGVRSIGYGSTAIPDTLKQVHGHVVTSYSAAAYRDAILGLLAQKENRLSHAQISQVQAAFSITRMAERYRALYLSIKN